MQGYRENGKPNQEAIRRRPWAGSPTVPPRHGRIKAISIVGGSNVYPSDLEAALDGCAKIREAAVVGRPDD